jgi:hypothetical protein
MRPFARIVLLAPAAILLAAAAPSKSITLERRVAKKAPIVRPVVSSLFSAHPVGLGVVDGRGPDDPTVVGAQKERGKILYEWTSTGSVPVAVSGIVAQTLRAWNVSLAGDGEADVSLALKLTRFRVDEISETFGSSYRAEVAFHADVVARGGEVLLSTDAAGKNETSGVDQRASTCNQVLTAALEEALMKIVAGTPSEASRPVVAPAPPPALPPPGTIAPAELFTELMRLKTGGVADEVLVAYIKQRKLSAPLSADEILRWTNSGIPQAAIQAALESR